MIIGCKSCRHSNPGTEHETCQFAAPGHGVVNDWLPAPPMIKALTQ
jgi:hypothetical protein